jgi:cell division protein FtsA
MDKSSALNKLNMKKNNKIIYAIDIGTTKVAAIVAQKNEFGKVEILGLGHSESFGVKRGVVNNIDKTVHAIRKAVAEAETQSGHKFTKVQVGIAGQHIKSLEHRGILVRGEIEEEISQKDIDRLKEDMSKLYLPPGEKIIHVLPKEYIVDNEQGVKEPIGMSGVRLEGNFHIITGQAGAIQNIYRCVNKAGLEVENVVLEPLASAAAVLSDEELEAGVAIVDIGGGTTDVAIFEEGVIRHTAVIPFGGDIITQDIKKGCMILESQAEQLKVKFGSALALDSQENEIVSIPGLKGRTHKEISLKNLSHIIEARMEEILEHVHYEIRTSDFDKKLIGGIVLTGGGSQLKHILQQTEFITGMEARLGLPNEHIASSKNKNLSNPIYATGIGLVIRAFNEMENRIELDINDMDFKQEVVEKPQDIVLENPPKVGKMETRDNLETDKNEAVKKERTPSKFNQLFQNIIEKGKTWIVEPDLEDFNDNTLNNKNK